MNKTIFHLAFPVHDLKMAKKFYEKGLGCKVGRESDHSLIFNFYGHQIVAQITDAPLPPQAGIYPRHFGLVFDSMIEWKRLLRRAKMQKLKFRMEEKVRFAGKPVEHRTFFLEDPSGNLLEFKFYAQESAIFGQKDWKKVGDRN